MSMKGNRIELCSTSEDLGSLPTCVLHAPSSTSISNGRFDVPWGTNRIHFSVKKGAKSFILLLERSKSSWPVVLCSLPTV